MNEQPAIAGQRRRGPAEIEQIVAEFAQSGLHRSEFCRRHRMSLGTLNWYLKRGGASTNNRAASGALVPVELADAKPIPNHECGSGLAVVLAGGHRIEVEAGFDAGTLARLVTMLEK
jgi:hypothetical protein